MSDVGQGLITLTPITIMAEEHPPSPKREDVFLSLGRLRVRPAMTVKGESPEVPRQKYTAYESNTKIPNPTDLRFCGDADRLRITGQALRACAYLI